MSLDLFNPLPALQNAQANLASDLPAEFLEAWDVSTRAMNEWNSSVNYANARDRALATYYDDVKAKTGVQLPLYGMGGNVSLEELNAAIGQLPQDPKQPEPIYPPLSEDDINTMTLNRMRKAREDAKAFSRRETTWGGTMGSIAGTLAAGISDPVTIATLPLGGSGQAGIALRALEFALIGGGTEAVIAGIGADARAAAAPGSLREIPGEIATAALFGGVFGAGIGGLQKLAGTGAKTLPVTVRDEVHAATSEAQLNLSNPFPSAAGEAAARDAAIDATRSAVRGEPVRAGDSFSPAHVADYALAAKSQTPEELAIAGEKHLRPETYGLDPGVERFGRLPGEADDVASYWEKRLDAATPEERVALGAASEDVSFTTAKGSTYEVQSDGTTIRNKAFRPEHGAAEQGIQPVSERTFYVDKAGLNALGEFQVQGAGKLAIAELPDGRWGVKYLEGKDAGKFEKRTVVHVNDEPATGLTPVELWKDGTRVHFGNEITEVRRTQVEARVSAPDLTPDQIVALEADPKTVANSIHDLENFAAANPEAEFSTQVRMPDGSYQFTTQKLSDVIKEIDEFERAGKELEACVIGLEAAE